MGVCVSMFRKLYFVLEGWVRFFKYWVLQRRYLGLTIEIRRRIKFRICQWQGVGVVVGMGEFFMGRGVIIWKLDVFFFLSFFI